MATYFVASGGSNTSPYDTWAKAATSLQTALTAASSGTDIVVIQYNAVPAADSSSLGADVLYTTANSVRIISASNDGGSSYTPTAMGTANFIGRGDGTTYRVGFATGADDIVYVYGVTFRISGTGADELRIGGQGGSSIVLDNCYLWQGTTTASNILIGASSTDNAVRLENCTIRFGATAQTLQIYASRCEFVGCTISADGSAPTTLCAPFYGNASTIEWSSCDLSHVSGTLVGNSGISVLVTFERCKLHATVTSFATQTSNPTASSARCMLLDCTRGTADDDIEHGLFEYHDAYGSLTTDTGIYFTTGDSAGRSWKIVTTANCSFYDPFISPPIDLYWTGTSAITPYLEILRDGSATAYDNNEVWGEFAAKVTADTAKATVYSDRCTLAAHIGGTDAAQADGAGTGSWTGENATAKSMKIDSGTAITPAEKGSLTARVIVGIASSTVYVDPQIRT